MHTGLKIRAKGERIKDEYPFVNKAWKLRLKLRSVFMLCSSSAEVSNFIGNQKSKHLHCYNPHATPILCMLPLRLSEVNVDSH